MDLPAQSDGQLLELRVETGDRVDEDEVIARLDGRRARGDLEAAEATLAAATSERERIRARLADSRQQLRRRLAAGTRAVSAEETQSSASEVEVLAAELAVAEHRREELRARLQQRREEHRDCTVRAPWPAVVAAALVQEGAWISRGQAIARLLSEAPPRVRFAVTEDARREMSVGDELEIEVLPIELEVHGRVDAIAPEIDPASGRVFVEASMELPDGGNDQLAPGQEAQVRLSGARQGRPIPE